ncbi:MAG: HNH endonuclease family protein, partial [Nanoarchaeota archaeon]|nr:HNH endonuclease family protein [Nanoarchaeota archaeon]
IKNFLTNPERYSSENIFREKLESNIYEINSEVARYILCKVEEENFTKESEIDLWRREKEKYVFTIEHILPEGERLPKEWVNMIAKGDKEEAKRLQEQFVHKLGNLTMTAYNSNLSNLSFDKKRDRKDKKGKNIGYKNNLYLNGEIYPLNNKKEWIIEDIEKRTRILIDEALKLFC